MEVQSEYYPKDGVNEIPDENILIKKYGLE